MGRIATEPLIVLDTICNAAQVRSERTGELGLQLWSKVVWGPTAGESVKAVLSAARIIQAVCAEVEAQDWPVDIDVDAAWLSDVTLSRPGTQFCEWVSSASTAVAAEGRVNPGVERTVVENVRLEIGSLVTDLAKVTEPSQIAIGREITDYLNGELLPALDRSLQLKVWLLRPDLLAESGAHLLTFGMRLRASGSTALSERVFLVLLSIASIVVGFASPALGVALGGASLLTTVKSPTEILAALSPAENRRMEGPGA